MPLNFPTPSFIGEIYTGPNGNQWEWNGSIWKSLTPAIAGPIDVTYSQLVSSIGSGSLIEGSYYLITDFKTCYDQPDFDYDGNPITSGNYKDSAPVEPIIVFAIGTDRISEDAYQPDYPNDRIKYDWTYSTTEVTGGAAYGRITERIDEWNNRTDYDHRNILFKRYRLYVSTSENSLRINGQIDLLFDGTVNGTDTQFTDLSVGDVIFIDSINPGYYEISNIADNVTMTVIGDVISPVSGSYFYRTIEITRGGEYFSYKRTNVKTDDYREYTTFGNALGSSYAINNRIGDYANDYLNLGETFMLSNNAFLIGPDDSNRLGNFCTNNTFGSGLVFNTFGSLCSNNALSGSKVESNSIANSFVGNIINTNLYLNRIGNVFQSNLLLAEDGSQLESNQIDDRFEGNLIYMSFVENSIGNNFKGNVIGDYSNINQGFYFQNNEVDDLFQNNKIGRSFYSNSIGTSFKSCTVYGDFYDNGISANFTSNEIYGGFYENTIDLGFNKNQVYSDFYANTVGKFFDTNRVGPGFFRNQIGSGFLSNAPYNYEYFGLDNLNTVLDRSYDVAGGAIPSESVILGLPLVMKVTSVGPERYFRVQFLQWTPSGGGGGFSYVRNEIDSSTGADIGSQVLFTKTNSGSEIDIIIPGVLEITRGSSDGIYNAATEGGWSGSSPADTQWNSVYVVYAFGLDFGFNQIGDDFSDNLIGPEFGALGKNSNGNLIGDCFQKNTIFGTFLNNSIGNLMTENTIDEGFINNRIKNYCAGNTIGPGWENNDIGDFFGNANLPNIIGGNFTNNKIGNFFGCGSTKDYGGNKIGTVTTLNYNSVQGIPSSISLTSGGSSYSNSSNVATTGVSGSGLTVDIVTDGLGLITSITINTPGTYYSVGDTITITGGGNDATLNIDSIGSFNTGDVLDNGLGDSCEVIVDDPGSSLMTVNVIIGEFANGETIDNGTGTLAIFDSISTEPDKNASFLDNVIGDYFINNQIGFRFADNQIGNYFGNSGDTGISNIILDDFRGNVIDNYFGIDVETPSTDEGGNIIRSNFIENYIGDSFIYNITVDTSGGGYYNNVIGWACTNNIIADGFNYNRLGDIFQFNILSTSFASNNIGFFFNVNLISDNFSSNVIGDLSWFNDIGSGFSHNKAGNLFGDFFGGGNTIGADAIDNIFSEHAVANTIGDNFFSNSLSAYFGGNLVGNDFQYNTSQYPVTGYDFVNPSPAPTHVYGGYTCTISGDQSGNLKLTYIDGTGTIVVVDPDE